MRRLLFALTLALAWPSMASAGPLTLNCPGGLQDMTSNSALNFGGSGIPKDAVCVGTFGSVTLMLTAHQRFVNPVVTNNGTDMYFAQTGDDTANGQPNYATWNFGWAAFNTSTSATYFTSLFWDTNPGFSTDMSQFGYVSAALAPGANSQNSWNLGMGFIDTGVAIPGVYAPAAGSFSPYANGNYGFAFNVYDSRGGLIGGIGAEVNAGTPAPVPEPASLGLMGLGLAFIARKVAQRRKNMA